MNTQTAKETKWILRLLVNLLLLAVTGCAHYPVNLPVKQFVPTGAYRGEVMGSPERSGRLLMVLTFPTVGPVRQPLPTASSRS
jgi:hypothetical protein